MQPRNAIQALLQSLGFCFLIGNTNAETPPQSQSGGPRWEQVDTSASSDANGNQYFVDTSGLRATEGGIGVTVLIQFRDPLIQDGYEIRSITRSTIVDCLHRRLAPIAVDWFTGARGTGQAVRFIDFHKDPPQWNDVEPSSADDAILGLICARV